MKCVPLALVAAMLVLATNTVWARDDIGDYSIEEAMGTADAKSKLGDEIKFYFGNQPHAAVEKNLGTVGTNKKTNAFGKSDKDACLWVFLSAMIALKDRALQEGANAVVDIKSNYKNNETSSDTTFKCGAGAIMAGVALRGTLVKLAQ